MSRSIGRRIGRLLHEQAQLAACGVLWEPPPDPPTLATTIEWAHRLPSSAHAAQGFTRTTDFARSVKHLRTKRAGLHKRHPEPLRRAMLDTLERVISDREDLMKAARREARCHWHPQYSVWWGSGKPQVYNSARMINGRYYARRDVMVPAAWLLARIGGSGNIANQVRQADPRPRVLSMPHWIDRVAAGALPCLQFWLTPAERAAVEARVAVRQARQRQIEVRKREAWRAAQERALVPSPNAPDTLGWRGWNWDGHVLTSPIQRTQWHDATLHAERWSDSAAVRGEAGIHARRVPVDWRAVDPRAMPEIGQCIVHGIVERFGRYVLGTEGWRAEWVVIRELLAPDTNTALALMRHYPEVRVHIKEQEVSYEDR